MVTISGIWNSDKAQQRWGLRWEDPKGWDWLTCWRLESSRGVFTQIRGGSPWLETKLGLSTRSSSRGLSNVTAWASSQHGDWALRGSKGRASVPRDQSRNSVASSDPALEGTQHHLHCIVLITTEPLRLAKIQGRGVRSFYQIKEWQDRITEEILSQSTLKKTVIHRLPLFKFMVYDKRQKI